LDDGVRAMLLDTHAWEGEAYLCHGFCELGALPLVEGLSVVRAFLDSHRGEVLAFIVEDAGGAPLDAQAAASYRLRFLDLVHAVVSVMVFAAVALFDQSVVSCFYPVPSEDVRQVLTVLPIAIGVVGSMLFVTFPTTRHGIGFPLSKH
jgi:hypothetical protein